MSHIARADIEELAALRCGHGQVVTCYVDLTAEEGMARHWRCRARQMAEEIRQSLTFDEVALHDFDQNYDAVLHALSSDATRGAQGLAIFSARLRNFLKVIPLDVVVPTELRLAKEPYLVPLLSAFFQLNDQYLVILAGPQEARLFSARPGQARLLEVIRLDPTHRPGPDPEQGGWSLPEFSRRREALVRFQDQIAAAAKLHWHGGSYDSVVLLAHADSLEMLKHTLPREILERVVYDSDCPESCTPELVEQTIGEIINVARRVLQVEFRRRMRSGEGYAAGPRNVVDWLDRSRPGTPACLLLGSDRGKTVSRCTACKHLSWYDVSTCPRCPGRCSPENLWEELLLRVFDNRWSVAFLDDHPALTPFEGVALLHDAKHRAARTTPATRASA